MAIFLTPQDTIQGIPGVWWQWHFSLKRILITMGWTESLLSLMFGT